jgi:uridine kinase
VHRPIVLGIAGGSASGKSTVVREVSRILGPGLCASIQHDAYYHDLSHMPFEERIKVNVDHPDSLETELLVAHVHALLVGRAIEMPNYDYVSQTRSTPGFLIEPAAVVIVEGLLAFHDQRLRALMDLKAFVDASEADRLGRRVARDIAERGRDRAQVVDQHESRVEPMHARFVQPTRAYADVLIPKGGHNLPAIESLVARIQALLTNR